MGAAPGGVPAGGGPPAGAVPPAGGVGPAGGMASVTASTVPHRWRCRNGAGAAGQAGDIRWNFEKFLIAPAGKIAGRFRPQTDPEVPELVAAIESLLPREGRPALSAVRTRPAKGRSPPLRPVRAVRAWPSGRR